MVRRLAVLSLFAFTGCSSLRDAVTAHVDVVARAAGQELTVNRLAELLAPQKQLPLQRDVVDRVAELWVDYQLLGSAVADGDSLLDSATVMAANWPAVMQRLADHLHDSLIVARAELTDGQVDSAYNVGEMRWLDHILFSVRQDTTPEIKAAKRRLAEGVLAQLERGASFARLASQRSDDPNSKVNGGSIGLRRRGELVKPFEDAAWALQPGQTSGLVETAFGLHIIRRPALGEVRDSFRVAAREAVIQRLDSLFMDSLTTKTDIRVRGSAPALVRSAATNVRAAKASSRVLATYRGGRLAQRDFARWLQAFPPQTRGMMVQAPDSSIVEFVRSIARNDMLLREAGTRRIGLTPADKDSIRERFRQDLEQMLNTAGVSAESLAADTAAGRTRTTAVARRVEAYVSGITASPPTRPFFEVPPFLADVLRSRYAWDISPAGVDRALEKARQLRGPELPPAAMPPMTPAPAGPPVGGPQPPAPQPDRRR